MSHIYKSKSLADSDTIAKAFADTLHCHFPRRRALVVALRGELGAGKTAFVKNVARYWGVADEVISPTFIIERIYRIHTGFTQYCTQLIHIDAYRLASAKELIPLDWERTLRDPRNIVFIEWPEHVADALPDDTVQVSFSLGDDGVRTVAF
jgi:tRNA threonylcarbamoyladenosine biosynthesis protein TsaE